MLILINFRTSLNDGIDDFKGLLDRVCALPGGPRRLEMTLQIAQRHVTGHERIFEFMGEHDGKFELSVKTFLFDVQITLRVFKRRL